jgi:tetratricopeptide (TPR) repeat protein
MPAANPVLRLSVHAISLLALLSLAQQVHAVPMQLYELRPTQRSVPDQLDKGMVALSAGDFTTAQRAFQEAAKAHPKAAAPVIAQAQLAWQRNDRSGALALLRRAEQLEPTSVDVHVALGRYWYVTRDYAKAEAAMRKAVGIDPKAFAPRIDLADLLMESAQTQAEAITHYRAAVAARPEHGGAHYGLAMSLTAASQTAEALREFEKAAQLAPDNPLPLQAMARVQMKAQNYDAALKNLDRAIKLNPQSVPARLDKGEILTAQGKVSEAIGEYESAVKVIRDARPLQLRLGMLYQREQRISQAEAAYKAAVGDDLEGAQAYNNLAWLASERKVQLDQALEWARKAVAIAPQEPSFKDTLAWVHRARKELGQSTKLLQEAAAAKGAPGEVHYHLGIVYEEQGQSAQAITALERALAVESQGSFAKDARERLARLKKSS